MNYVCAFSRLLEPRRFFSVAVLLAVVLPTSSLLAQATPQRQQTRPRVQMPRRPTVQAPANRGVASQPIDRAIQASAGVQRYHFKIEQQPALATLEGDLDAAGRTAYVKISLARQSIPPAEIWVRNGQAYGRHAYLNRYFKLKGLTGFPDYLQAAVALAKSRDKTAWREEAGLLKLDFPMDISASSQKVEQRLDTWLKSSKHKDRHTFLQTALAGLKGLTATGQVSVPKNAAMINRLVLRSQNASGRSVLTTFSFSPVGTSKPFPAQALRAKTEISVGALFYRLRSIQGWCGKTHRFLAVKSLELMESEDPKREYAGIYGGNRASETEWGQQSIDQRKGTNRVMIGVSYEDDEHTQDNLTNSVYPLYSAWFDKPQDYFAINDMVRDYRHFGGDGQGLEDSWLFDLRSGDSTPDLGDYYYSARDWGWNAPGKNLLTFREAIRLYGLGTYKSQQGAVVILGHVVHLLQDQAMPDHAALIIHPGSAWDDPTTYNEIPLCELLAGEILAAGCGFSCLPLDLICYGTCSAIISGAVESARQACEAGIDPDERGYEKVVEEEYPNHYAQANVAARVAQVGSVRLPDYNAYFHEVAALSTAEASSRGLTQPLGVGGHPATAIIDYPVDPYIHRSSESEKRPFFELTDAVGTIAITRCAGLMKQFVEIVNPPPIVSSVVIRQNNEIRFQAIWSVKADPQGNPYRQVTRINKPLYPGTQANLVVQFGPALGSASFREMSTLTVKLDNQTLNMTDKVNGYSHSYETTFTPPCTGTSSKIMQLSFSGADNSPHYSGRSPQLKGNILDRDPATYARAAADPPYAFSGYEQGGSYNESITVGPADTCWKDVTEYNYCGDSVHWDMWKFYKGQGLLASLKILEVGSENAPVVAANCGRYRLSLAPTIKFRKRPEDSGGTGPHGLGQVSMWAEGPPSQFGLTLSMDDPYSMQPKITITHSSQESSSPIADRDIFEARVPVILTFEPASGPAKEMCRVEQKMEIAGMYYYWKAVNDCIVHSTIWQRWVGPWEEVEIGPEVIRTIDISKTFHSGATPETQRGAAYFAKLQPAGGREVLFISPAGQSSMEVSLQTAGIAVTRTNDPKIFSVKASAGTRAGTYIIPFSAGRGAAVETVVVIKVTR